MGISDAIFLYNFENKQYVFMYFLNTLNERED